MDGSVWRLGSPAGRASRAGRALLQGFCLAAALWLAAAQAEPALPSALASRSLLLDIAQAGTRLVAVGERGHILYSDDRGASWQQAEVPSRQLLTALFFVDARHGWAVGHDTQILHSADGGAHWQLQHEDPPREAPLLDVWFADARRGLAVGAYGTLLATEDGGVHWADAGARLDNPDGLHLNAIAAIPGAGLLVVGEAGLALRSADGGATWERLPAFYEGSLFGVLGSGEPGVALAFGLRGHLFRSTDGGASWTPLALPVPGNGPLQAGLSGGTRLADGSLLIVGHGGTLLHSRDGGDHFALRIRPDRLSLSAVAEAGDGRLLLVGQGGVHEESMVRELRGGPP